MNEYRLRGPLQLNFYDGAATPVLLHSIAVDVKQDFPLKVEPQTDELNDGTVDVLFHKITMEYQLDEYNPADLSDLNTTEKVEVVLLAKGKTVTIDKSNPVVKAMSVHTSLDGPKPKIEVTAIAVTTDGDWTAAVPVT